EAAALVAAAMVSVLTFPLLAFRLLGRGEGDAGPGAPSRAAESGEAW
ncbi:cation:proton antiporter, partial [Streptomyces sp. MBT58]|nr:cation:proton antiporter [Streptomyces sp. MBT58]